ncbi:endolytic transglycosylase MltG [Deinococcus koreensis]|uniref:Endolytic murein transglycosylase n=1 Tax=Deinococcus koreensis TaxID=2054903 RepID=A0A2K3UUM2_9DEIO|nr:endolytic transglycosylase MltG [Deinococcus koreensis]PNY80236.1 endolytic transglycosylase MltG [Deinococcus koreensis]
MTRLRRPGTPWWVWALLSLLALIVVAGLGVFLYVRSLFGPAGGAPYTLTVKPGDSLPAVARTLEERGIVKNARVLRYVMDRDGTAGRLKEGLYDLRGDMSVDQVAARLAGPARLPSVNVTVPEGRRIQDIPAIFEKAGFDGAAVLSVLKNASLSEYAKGKQPNLEGFVFPDTYAFRPKETPQRIVQTMLGRMASEFTPENVAKARALGLGVRDWVILASMVQAEAANDAEMPVVAGVFLNRLRDGIALGSDPTVAYGLGKDLPELDRSAGDFTRDTPYSTYTRQGLPAGPINNPGRAALLSVLNPTLKMSDGRDALYFLHGLDGRIYVNHDYAAHLRDVARYR